VTSAYRPFCRWSCQGEVDGQRVLGRFGQEFRFRQGGMSTPENVLRQLNAAGALEEQYAGGVDNLHHERRGAQVSSVVRTGIKQRAKLALAGDRLVGSVPFRGARVKRGRSQHHGGK
jgi:hypothetical protein